MNVRVVQETILMRDNLKELFKDIVIKQEKCVLERNKIRDKYVEETNIKDSKTDTLIDKNLIIYLLMKHRIDLSKPLDIGGYRINCRSKRLIMYIGKSNFNIDMFITQLQRMKDQKFKPIIKDITKYFKDYDDYDNGDDLEFQTRIKGQLWKIEVDHEFRYDDEENKLVDDENYIIDIKILNLKEEEIAKFKVESNRHSKDYDINLYSIKKIEDYTNEKFISIIDKLYDGVYNEALKISKKIDEQLKLLGEFSLV